MLSSRKAGRGSVGPLGEQRWGQWWTGVKKGRGSEEEL